CPPSRWQFAQLRGPACRRYPPAPVPRLVRDPVVVVAWIGQMKPVTSRVARQPRESGGAFEFFLECGEAGRGEVDRAAGMVLAVARRGADAQDLVDRQSAREFAFEDSELVFDRAEGGDGLQFDAVLPC